jgi:hypothetical protein
VLCAAVAVVVGTFVLLVMHMAAWLQQNPHLLDCCIIAASCCLHAIAFLVVAAQVTCSQHCFEVLSGISLNSYIVVV